jgi:putative membrane protein
MDRHHRLFSQHVPVPALLALLIALPMGGRLCAQTLPTTPSTGPGATAVVTRSMLSRADRQFVEDAVQSGMAELAFGKIAQQRGSHARVKTFGDRMAQDHGQANAELMRLAQAKGVPTPSGLSRSHQSEADKLMALSGAEFDRAYTKLMLDEHKKDVAAFQKAARGAQDTEVKGFAARTLPTLESHLQMAQLAHDEIHNSARSTGAAAPPTAPSSR